jgi:N-acetylneuraminate synthase
MSQEITIGTKTIGPGHPTFIIAEIGINHNGELKNAFGLIDAAVLAGCDAVKFQKRTSEICVPKDQWDIKRDTPWGEMRYIDYRNKIEFGEEEYAKIDAYCAQKEILWFVSCWDEEAVSFMEQFNPPTYKIASASLTDTVLLKELVKTKRPLILSSGMSTQAEIDNAVDALKGSPLAIAHSTSSYPCPAEELNLKMIHTLNARFPNHPIGYSGHEVGLQTSIAAIAMGATFIERHITLDRTMWGSDQSASVEPWGLMRLVRDIRVVEKARGDGVKRVYPSEEKARQKLRRNSGA